MSCWCPAQPQALKITTQLDLAVAEAAARRPPTPKHHGRLIVPDFPYPIPRTGIGVDVHAFATLADPQPLWLGGLLWEGEQGLAGHSDGDAAAHAAGDALFSAAGVGDLGTHFGTDRPEYAGASGATACCPRPPGIVREAGFEIGNIAVQLVCNRPKFGPRRSESEAVLSEAAGAPVSVSATTSDGLGFTGRGEGIAAVATAVVVSVRLGTGTGWVTRHAFRV